MVFTMLHITVNKTKNYLMKRPIATNSNDGIGPIFYSLQHIDDY
jgi:hypothetical protein